MAKFVRVAIVTAFTVIGAAIGGPIGASIGTFIGTFAANLLLPPSRGRPRGAASETLRIGEVPRQAIVGRAATHGSLADAFNYGGKYGTDWEVLVIALADHHCDALEGFYVNDNYVPFGSDGAVAGYNNQLSVWWRPGTETQTVPSVLTANGAGWTADDNGAGVSYAVVAYKADASDAKNPVWPNGRPRFLFVMRGALCYDPRLDSTVGGAGAHRWADPATWTWSENPIVTRYKFARGFFACDRVNQPEQLLVGRGLSTVEAPPANLFHRANLCDEMVDGEPRYRVGGMIEATETYIDVENDFAAACAGTIVQPEGSVEIDPGEAKAPIMTITDADLVVGSKVKRRWFLGIADRAWVNSVVASYIEPSQKWSAHTAPVRRDIADIQADGAPREEALSLGFVQWQKQAGRIAEIVRRVGRLHIRAELVLPPRLCELEEGDWIIWQSDRYLKGQAYTFRVEAWGSDKAWHHSVVLRQISASCYSDTAPLTDGSVAVQQAARPAIGAPSAANWSVSAGHFAGGGIRTPALIVSGSSDDPSAQFVRLEYTQIVGAPTAATVWSDAGVTGPDVKRREIAVAAGGIYWVAISYVVDGVQGDRRVLGPVTALAVVYPDGTPVESLKPGEAGANNTSIDANGQIQGVSSGTGTTVDNNRVLVGARNLMINSGQFTNLSDWFSNGAVVSLDNSVLYGQYNSLRIVGSGGAGKNTVMRLKPNTQYTVSAMVRGSSALAGGGDTTLHIQNWRNEDTVNLHQETAVAFDTSVTTSWKLIYYTFRTPSSAALTYCRFYFFPLAAGFTLNVGYVKLEEGNKATDWTQAPEEVTAGINAAATTADWANVKASDPAAPHDYATRNVNRGAWSGASVAYIVGDFVQRNGSSYSVITAHTSTAGNGPPGANWELLAAQGTPAITGFLTNEAVQLFAYANGDVVSYAGAAGVFRIFSGTTDVSTSFTLSTIANPQALTVGYTGQTYSVTGGFVPNEDTASLTIRATGSGAFAGVTLDKVLSLSKAKGGYEIVAALPTTNLFEGRVVFRTSDDKLYRYTGTMWTASTAAADLSGTINYQQIGDGAVRVQHLLVAPNNLNPDPYFLDEEFWSQPLDAGGWFFETSNVGNYPWGLGLAKGLTITERSATRAHAWSRVLPFTGSGQSVRLRVSGINGCADGVNVTARFYNATNAILGDLTVHFVSASGPVVLSEQVSVPAGATKIQFIVFNNGFNAIAANTYATIGGIKLEFATDATLIVNGSIIADKLAVASVTGAKVAASNVITQSAQISDAIITNAKIGDLAVNTLKIAGNAVTAPYSATLASPVTLSSSTGGINNLVALSFIPATSSSMYVAVSGTVTNIDPTKLYNTQFQLFNNGTPLHTSENIILDTDGKPSSSVAWSYSDLIAVTPGITNQIILRAEAQNAYSNSNVRATKVTVFALETKR